MKLQMCRANDPMHVPMYLVGSLQSLECVFNNYRYRIDGH